MELFLQWLECPSEGDVGGKDCWTCWLQVAREWDASHGVTGGQDGMMGLLPLRCPQQGSRREVGVVLVPVRTL